MARRFLAVTVSLAAAVAFLAGLVVAGALSPAPVVSAMTSHPTQERDRPSISVSP